MVVTQNGSSVIIYVTGGIARYSPWTRNFTPVIYSPTSTCLSAMQSKHLARRSVSPLTCVLLLTANVKLQLHYLIALLLSSACISPIAQDPISPLLSVNWLVLCLTTVQNTMKLQNIFLGTFKVPIVMALLMAPPPILIPYSSHLLTLIGPCPKTVDLFQVTLLSVKMVHFSGVQNNKLSLHSLPVRLSTSPVLIARGKSSGSAPSSTNLASHNNIPLPCTVITKAPLRAHTTPNPILAGSTSTSVHTSSMTLSTSNSLMSTTSQVLRIRLIY